MKQIILLQLAIALFGLASWGMNVAKFVGCDFEPSYKAEVIHGIGLFTPICLVTGWLDLGK